MVLAFQIDAPEDSTASSLTAQVVVPALMVWEVDRVTVMVAVPWVVGLA